MSVDPEQYEEWRSLRQQAKQRLRKGSRPERWSVHPLFQMLVLPSFENACSWEICQDGKAAECHFAVRCVWHMTADLCKFETPVVRLRYPRPLAPTIEVRQYPMEAVWVEATLTALKSVTIPAMVEQNSVGLDGTSYEVAFNAGQVQARYGWWGEPPSGWHSLSQWFHQTLDALEKLTVSEQALA